MAKAKKKAPAQTQAQRLLELARKNRTGKSDKFSEAMGKATMAKNARKTPKGQLSG